MGIYIRKATEPDVHYFLWHLSADDVNECKANYGSTVGLMAVAGATMSASQQAKAEGAAIDSQNRQAQEMVKQMNYSDANLRMQERDLKEQQMAELTETTLNGIRNQGMVRAAVAESGLEGNSMDRIERQVEGDTVKERAGLPKVTTATMRLSSGTVSPTLRTPSLLSVVKVRSSRPVRWPMHLMLQAPGCRVRCW
uniref:Internal virion protein n=1 Tax=Escherichia virus LS2 TaxID=2743776 RepID=A0A7D5FNP8_9CAUD